ncbi:NAD(P)H-binding protein [Nocardia aurantiaca]|uniref:NAD(P)H-binding protein n=1 Tax=Nocardia aurantiaca TaxID=2675850 RepID=A0A6I3KYW5_9NOCA|nr:NAD(P)H-binding protein [Nocardia aurantiaca]MTE13656.1 NAD(P)H-binding protein [Nocardia aurantiaca]
MIVITGATGTIGSEVVRLLADKDVKVRAVTRDPEHAQLPAEAEVVRGDYADIESMTAAFAGAEAAFLVGLLGPDYVELDRALVAAACAAGVRRLVKLSAIGTGDTELGRVGTWHMPGEQAVRDSGAAWTILRPSSFASNTLSWAPMLRAGQPVPNMTGTGGQGVVDPRDVSEVATTALLSDTHSGQVYTLTGPEVLSVHDQAAALAAVLGRAVEVVDISETQAREFMLDAGMSEEFADGSLAGRAYVRAGRNEIVTGDVEQVLGRAPRSYADWVRDHAAAFTD